MRSNSDDLPVIDEDHDFKKWRKVVQELLLVIEKGDLETVIEANRNRDTDKIKLFSRTELHRIGEKHEEQREKCKRERGSHIHKSINIETDAKRQPFNAGEKMS